MRNAMDIATMGCSVNVKLAADGETAEWMLEEEITSATASDAWVLSSPVRYPADGTEMTTFLGQIGNLRLGSYVGEATEENLEAFGFTPPSMEMIFHMAEGMTAVTGDDGAVTTQVLPEETVHLALGDNKNEYVRYVL